MLYFMSMKRVVYDSKRHFLAVLLALACMLAVCVALCLLSSCDTAADVWKEHSDKLRVEVKTTEGIKVHGDASIEVSPGEMAEFKVSVKKGYVYIGNSANARYTEDTGALVLFNVKYPTSVEIFTICPDEMLSLECSAPLSALVSDDSVYGGYYNDGDTAVVTARSEEGYTFIGWSVGAYLSEGGVLVSAETEYSFKMTESVRLYANYEVSGQKLIIYHANGGTVAKSGGELIAVSVAAESQYTCRNTLHSDGTFVRDGYIAVGYSTEPVEFEAYDTVNAIPGFSNMGGVCVFPEGSVKLELWVVWAKVSPKSELRFEEKGDSYALKRYDGSGSVAVIPQTHNGKPVTAVLSGAFSSTALKTVVLPDTIETISEKAFSLCTTLKQIVFFDGVKDVSNDSFDRCGRLSTIVLNSQRLPYYSESAEGAFCLKYERVKTAPGKMLVVVSGSSTLNGMQSETFQKAYPDHTIVNYGTNAGTPSYFYLKVIANYVGEGDIIIHAGEYTGTTLGSNRIEWKLFRGNEQCYDIFREVDMTEFTNFWNAFKEFQNDRGDKGAAYQRVVSVMNKYGDLVTNRSKNNGFKASGGYNFYSPGSYLSADNAARLNSVSDLIVSKGGVMLGSFATLDLEAVAAGSRSASAYDYCTKYFSEKLKYPIISNVGDYVFEHKYFYDSIWHCTLEGAMMRTERLLSDLRRYLEGASA